jgi:hypothetical protein
MASEPDTEANKTMRAFTNTIAALGLIGAAAVSAPAPASAQGVYFGAPGVSLGIGVPPYYGPGYSPYYYPPGYYRPYWGHRHGYRSWGGRRHGSYGPGRVYGFYGPGPAYGFDGRPRWRHPYLGYRHHGFYGRPYRHYGFRGRGFYGRAMGHRIHRD